MPSRSFRCGFLVSIRLAGLGVSDVGINEVKEGFLFFFFQVLQFLEALEDFFIHAFHQASHTRW